MELKKYWQILRKRRAWLATVFVLIVAAVGAWTFASPPTFEATAKIMLITRDRTLSSFGREMEDLGKLSTVSINSSPQETQAEVLLSAPVVEQVIASAELTNPEDGSPISVKTFRTNAQVMIVKGTDILEVSYQDTDPARAARVVEAWSQAYIEDNKAANREQAASAAKFLAGQLEKTRKELSAAEAALQDFRRRNVAIDLSEQARASIQNMSALDDQVRQTTAAQVEAGARVAALRSRIGLSSTDALAATALSQDANIQRLRAQLVDAETNLSTAGLAANHPDVKRRREQVAMLRGQLAKEAASLVGRQYAGLGLDKGLDPVRQSLTTELVQAEISALGYATRLESLKSLAGTYNGRLSALPAKQFQLTQLERRAAVANDLFRALSKRYEETRIQAEVSSGNVRLIEGATAPTTPVRPRKALNMAIAVILGLGLGLGAAYVREYLEDSIQTVEDAEKTIPLPMLGIVPWLGRRRHIRLITLREPRAPVSEAYRTLRTNLKVLTNDTLRAFTITSAGAGEGKSTTISNLAVTYAQAGKRVVIVDADMRKPSQHRIFELPNDVGLSTILNGEADLDQAVKHTAMKNLDVLTAGPLPPDPAELLESERLGALIETLKQSYDLVLFDAPPVIAVADASILGAQVDGLMLVLGLSRVSRRAARHALQRLEAAQVRTWGVVAAGMRSEHDPYYHAYYASYYGEVAKERGFGSWAFWRRPKAG